MYLQIFMIILSIIFYLELKFIKKINIIIYDVIKKIFSQKLL